MVSGKGNNRVECGRVLGHKFYSKRCMYVLLSVNVRICGWGKYKNDFPRSRDLLVSHRTG